MTFPPPRPSFLDVDAAVDELTDTLGVSAGYAALVGTLMVTAPDAVVEAVGNVLRRKATRDAEAGS